MTTKVSWLITLCNIQMVTSQNIESSQGQLLLKTYGKQLDCLHNSHTGPQLAKYDKCFW